MARLISGVLLLLALAMTSSAQSKPAPAVISDNMNMLKHHGTGKFTDSKRAFSRMTKDAGLVEYGTDMPKPRNPIRLSKEERVRDIKNAIEYLESQ